VKRFSDNPQQAFPGNGQMKPEQLEIAQLKREVAKLKAERDILKKAAVDSTDERNMMEEVMFIRRIRSGTDGTTWLVVAAETRAVGTVESGPIANRNWPQPRQASRLNLWCCGPKRRHSASGKKAVTPLAIYARTRGDIPRIGRWIIVAKDCYATPARTLNDQSRGLPK
jgi:hypothetical protein